MLFGSTRLASDVFLIATAIALVIIATVLITCFRSYSRLRHIPGPRSGAFSKLWMVRATASGQMVSSASLCGFGWPVKVLSYRYVEPAVSFGFVKAKPDFATVSCDFTPYSTASRLSLLTEVVLKHLWLAEACKQYGIPVAHDFLAQTNSFVGHLVRIGPNDLVTDDGEILRKVNGVRSPYTRSEWYSATAFSHDLNHAFCERDDLRHTELRNRLIPGVISIHMKTSAKC